MVAVMLAFIMFLQNTDELDNISSHDSVDKGF